MKPLKLVLEGFMPFRARTEVEFSDLELFAIQGATGSGKSSLLDAITYALYGKTDRLGATGAEALISSGEQQFTVELTFALGSDIYRATRMRGRKATQNNARLDRQLEAGKWQSLATSTRSVETMLTKLLGLDFQSFTRAIMLPQGKFNALLHGKKSERQTLLGELTDLGHVTEMYSHAAKRHSDLQTELRTIQAVLGSEYSAVNAEALSTLQAESRDLETQLQHLTDERDSLQQTLTRLRAQEGLHREHQDLLAQQAALSAQAQVVSAGAQRAQQARSVAHILPLLSAAQAGETQLQRSQEQAQVAQVRAQEAQQAHAAASATLETLRAQQQAQQTEHRAQLERLEQLLGVLPLLQASQGQAQSLARAEATAHKQAQALAAAQHRLEAAQQAEDLAAQQAAEIPDLEKQAAELEQAGVLQAKLKQFGAAPTMVHDRPLAWDENKYFAAREAARKLEEVRRQAALAEAARASIERQQQENRLAFKHQEAEEKRLERLKQEGIDLKAQQEKAKAELHASGLAQYHAELKVGEACCLCGQTVKTLPAPPLAAESAEALSRLIDDLERQLTLKRSEFDELRGYLRTAGKQLETKRLELEAKAADSLTDLATLQQEAEQYGGDEPETAQRYLAGLAQKVSHFGADPAAERAKTLKRLEALRGAVVSAQQAQAQAASALAAAQASWQAAQDTLGERQQEAQAAQQQLNERLQDVGLSAAEVTAAPDPVAQRRALNAASEQLQSQVNSAGQAQAQAASTLAGAQATLQAARSALQQRQHEAQQAQATLNLTLAKLALSAEQVSQAALPEAEIEVLEAAQRRHQAQAEQLSAQLEALSQKLGAAPFDPAQLTQTERAYVAAESALGRAQQRSGELKHAATDLEQRLERKREQLALSSGLARQVDLWGTLSTSLRTNEFQQFLLEDLESRLLEGAGTLLHTISDGRYRLATEGGDYMVQDLWNAGELRGVKTLSGGETFLASLALAITLSDYLAGNKVLGALFLDEGFGTLDPQALESVAEALENLRTQGRMVGVITHVESLSERLPSRLVVSKSVAGSSVTRMDS